MNTAADNTLRYRELADGMLDPGGIRVAALDRLEKLGGLPDARDELWRNLNLRSIRRRPITLPDLADTDREPSAAPGLDLETLDIVLGDPIATSTPIDGLRLRTFDSMLSDEPELAARLSTDAGPLEALALALHAHSMVIEVAADVRIELPIRILQAPATATSAGLHAALILVRMEAGSEMHLIDHHVFGAGIDAVSAQAWSFGLAERAHLTYQRIAHGARAGSRFATHRARLESGARLSHRGVDLGGALNRTELHVSLDGVDASADASGLYISDGKQQVDNRIVMRHLADRTTSTQRFRGLAAGRSRAIWNGRAIIEAGTRGCEAHQEDRNILLSEEAEVDPRPELEIYADEVIASHGATVGQLDEEALFYLLSRGIDSETARALLIFAFADLVLTEIDDPGLRAAIEREVMAALPEAAGIEDQLVAPA